jgi:hypothetical protein
VAAIAGSDLVQSWIVDCHWFAWHFGADSGPVPALAALAEAGG